MLLLNEIIENLSFTYDAPVVLATQLEEDYTATDLSEYPFKNRLKSSPLVFEFLKSIKGFVQESGFEKFYQKHLNFYEDCIKKVGAKIDFKQLSHFEEFYKENTDREYIINLLPLHSNNNLYYDYFNDDKYIINLAPDRNGSFDSIENYFEGWIFKIFSCCKIRSIIEKFNLSVKQQKKFEDMLKTQYVASGNINYVCEQIVKVLRTAFKEKYCPQFLEIDPNLVQNELEMFKNNGLENANEIYDIVINWQRSNQSFEDCLQQILNLF